MRSLAQRQLEIQRRDAAEQSQSATERYAELERQADARLRELREFYERQISDILKNIQSALAGKELDYARSDAYMAFVNTIFRHLWGWLLFDDKFNKPERDTIRRALLELESTDGE